MAGGRGARGGGGARGGRGERARAAEEVNNPSARERPLEPSAKPPCRAPAPAARLFVTIMFDTGLCRRTVVTGSASPGARQARSGHGYRPALPRWLLDPACGLGAVGSEQATDIIPRI